VKVSIISTLDLGKVVDEVDCENMTVVEQIARTRSWAPASFKSDRRLNVEFEGTDLLVLDIDEGLKLPEAIQQFSPYKCLILASKNHQKEKNGRVEDRFRVIIWLTRRCDKAADFKATWKAAQGQWPVIDRQASDPARFYYASPETLFKNEAGLTFDVVEGLEVTELDRALEPEPATLKGNLWKSTLEFLLRGAPAGHRHGALVKATMNMREQGYAKEEVTAALRKMIRSGGSWSGPDLNEKDLRTIDDVFGRVLKYDYEPTENEEEPIAIDAAGLLPETWAYLSDKDAVKGDPTGFEGLDQMLGGGKRLGELTVLMAQAKTGKNALYHYLLQKMLVEGKCVGYASRELDPATEVLPNLLSIGLNTNMWHADITEELKTKAQDLVKNWRLYFAPGYGYFPLEQLEAWFRALASEGVSYFLFDHFHHALMTEDYESTVNLAKKLKTLTKELNIHIDLIVQPRNLRDGERLSLATLRGGAAIGQALDNLLILERRRGVQVPNVSELRLEVARHRLATPGKMYIQYDPITTTFQEVDLIMEDPSSDEGHGPDQGHGPDRGRGPGQRHGPDQGRGPGQRHGPDQGRGPGQRRNYPRAN
jgi:hypothetical protein